jgi:formylglycine-generating enzyme required for sulfatase activity
MKKFNLFKILTAAVLMAFVTGCYFVEDIYDNNNPGSAGTGAAGETGAVTVRGVSYIFKDVPGGIVPAGVEWTSSSYSLPYTIPGFKIGQTEITYELWYAVREWAVNDGGYLPFANPGLEGSVGSAGAPPTDKKTHPVTTVSWRDCVVWCNAYSEAAGLTPVYYEDAAYTVVLKDTDGAAAPGAGKPEIAYIKADADGFRLPTIAQWEYAARGGAPATTAPWKYIYAGSDDIETVAWYQSNSGATHPVAKKLANTLGLYDMTGNISEWCYDKAAGASKDRLHFGGCFGSNGTATVCKINFPPRTCGPGPGSGHAHSDVGFRVIRL